MRNKDYDISEESSHYSRQYKKVALDKSTLKKSIFGLFEISKKWTLDEVCQRLDQPREPAKRALEEIAVLNKRTGEYELKEHFH